METIGKILFWAFIISIIILAIAIFLFPLCMAIIEKNLLMLLIYLLLLPIYSFIGWSVLDSYW